MKATRREEIRTCLFGIANVLTLGEILSLTNLQVLLTLGLVQLGLAVPLWLAVWVMGWWK